MVILRRAVCGGAARVEMDRGRRFAGEGTFVSHEQPDYTPVARQILDTIREA